MQNNRHEYYDRKSKISNENLSYRLVLFAMLGLILVILLMKN